jgi:hypothetical protein
VVTDSCCRTLARKGAGTSPWLEVRVLGTAVVEGVTGSEPMTVDCSSSSRDSSSGSGHAV